VQLPAEDIPADVVPFLPLAERWGDPDDGYRGDLLDAASPRELRSLVEQFEALGEDALTRWLAGPRADEPATETYVRLSALTMAVDSARLRQ